MPKYRIKEYVQESNEIWYFIQKKLWWWPWYYCASYKKYKGQHHYSNQTYGYKTRAECVMVMNILKVGEKDEV